MKAYGVYMDNKNDIGADLLEVFASEEVANLYIQDLYKKYEDYNSRHYNCLTFCAEEIEVKESYQPEYLIEEETGFELKCNKCGSTNTSHEYSIDYNWEEESFISGYEFYCEDCGSFKQF